MDHTSPECLHCAGCESVTILGAIRRQEMVGGPWENSSSHSRNLSYFYVVGVFPTKNSPRLEKQGITGLLNFLGHPSVRDPSAVVTHPQDSPSVRSPFGWRVEMVGTLDPAQHGGQNRFVGVDG